MTHEPVRSKCVSLETALESGRLERRSSFEPPYVASDPSLSAIYHRPSPHALSLPRLLSRSRRRSASHRRASLLRDVFDPELGLWSFPDTSHQSSSALLVTLRPQKGPYLTNEEGDSLWTFAWPRPDQPTAWSHDFDLRSPLSQAFAKPVSA